MFIVDVVSHLGYFYQQVMDLDLTPHVNLAAADPAAEMNSIESRGFYLQLPPGSPTDTF